MKVLIDHNACRNAVVFRSVAVPKTVRWGAIDVTADVLQRQEFLPRGDEAFRAEQLPYLATVGELTRARRVRLFTSFELTMERMRQRNPNEGYVGLSLLDDVEFEHARSPVDRTIVIGGPGRTFGLTEEEQMDFFRSIRAPRFLEIRKWVADPGNPDAHIDDAFHLWNAEVAGLDAFLTLDRRFIEVMAGKGRRAGSPVRVLSPRALCDALGEGPTDLTTLSAKYPPFRCRGGLSLPPSISAPRSIRLCAAMARWASVRCRRRPS